MHRLNSQILRSLLLVPLVAVPSLFSTTAATASQDADLTAPEVPGAEVPGADLTCVMSGTATISPGVTLLPESQEVSIHLQGGTAALPATPCTSVTGLPYQGFTAEATGSGEIACSATAFGERLAGTGVVTWDNGDTSTVVWSLTTVTLLPVIDIEITEGPLAGSTLALGGVVPTSFTGNCVLNPVTSFGFSGVSVAVTAGD